MRTTRSLQALLLGITAFSAACADSSRDLTTQPTSLPATSPSGVARFDRSSIERRDNVRIVRATGDITLAVTQYRDLLGPLHANVPEDQGDGRREINWDGVPLLVTNNDNFPGNFFNVNSPRGVLLSTPGSAFHITNQSFTEVNPAYANEFTPFSSPKTFVARGSTIIDVDFVVAGKSDPATVTGFGSVFEDVGRAGRTTIEYFDVNGRSLLKVAAPRASDASGISFVGAVFDAPIVKRVRITAGDTPMDATAFDNVKGAGKKFDIVATDDFIYGEPHGIRN